MKGKHALFLAMTFFFFFSSRVSAQEDCRLVRVREFRGGALYRAGVFSVLELSGSYREMGRQYGALLREDLQAFYREAVVGFFLGEKGMSPEDLKKTAFAVFGPYPLRYRDILAGMAETSGLDLEQHVLLNAVEWYPKIAHLSAGKARCSGIAAWGTYSADGRLVFGRNNDDDPLYRKFSKYLTTAIFKPEDGSLPTAVINYAGAVYAPTGMNSRGLFAEMNAGPWMGFALNRTSIFTEIFSWLQDFASLPEMEKAILSTLPNLASIINAADSESAASYELSLQDSRKADPGQEGLLASTNHFVNPSWPFSGVEDRLAGMTVRRRGNLLQLGERYRGKFTPEIMMNVLDTTLEDGGATVGGTIYQVVAVPWERSLWLKAPGVQDWTKIPLAPLF